MGRVSLPHIRLGVIGCGVAARALHGPAIAQCRRIVVTGVFDLRAESARRMASQFDTARLYDWAEEIIDDPAIDAVAILTPPSAHASLVETALRAEKHVLVEQPLALTSADAWHLAELARRSELVCAVGFQLRQHRLVQRARQAIASRRIGRVGAVHSVWSSTVFQRLPQDSWRNFQHLGGNLLFELGVHHLDLWRFLLGEDLHALHAEKLEVGEASARVQLVTRSFSGVLVHTTLMAGQADYQEVEILGERGAIRFALNHPYSYRETTCDREARPAAARGTQPSPRARWSTGVGEVPEGFAISLRGGDEAAAFRAQWEGFAEAVMLGGKPAASFDDGYLALELVERAYGASLRQIDLHPRAEQGVAEAGPATVARDSDGSGRAGPDPSLSVIVSTPNGFDTLKPLLAHLRVQTVVNDVELVMVVPTRGPFEPDPLWLDMFHSWQLVRIPAFASLATGKAAGVRHARAALVVLASDHSFPEPQWAESLVLAHQAGHAAVSAVVRNANPETNVSWADFLMHGGNALHGSKGEMMDSLPGHSCCYRRSVLLELGEDLESWLAMEAALPGGLRAQGHSLYLEPQAITARVNYAVFDSWIAASFFAGRVSAGLRTENWNALRRLLYCLAAIFVPYVRLARSLAAMERAGYAPHSIWRTVPHLWLGLTVESLGEFLGYATGAGKAESALAHYQHHRSRHVTAVERETLFERFQRA